MNRSSSLWVSLFFALYLVLGLSIVSDYGISWDEAKQRRNGLISLDHIIRTTHLPLPLSLPDVNLETSGGRQYTVLFPIISATVERALGLEDNFRGRFLMRHVLTFLHFWVGCIFLFRLLQMRLKNTWLALLLTACFIATPRIFAHSFYNPKDIILLSLYIIGAFYLVRYFEQPSWKRAVHFAIATGLVVNSRILGLMIPVFAIGFAVFLLSQNWTAVAKRHQLLRTFLIYLVLASGWSLLLFPYAWGAPLERTRESFELMANFPWGSSVLYLGQFIKGEHIPWHYPYVWMAITIPIPYLILMLLGIGQLCVSIVPKINPFKPRRWNTDEIIDLTALALLAGPFIAITLFQSTIYNGWRQLFFVYPIMILIAGIGLQHYLPNPSTKWRAGKWKVARWISIGLSIYVFGMCFWMYQQHPHQQVYFNQLAGSQKVYRFDMDYWGLAYKQAMEELYHRDTTDIIQIKCANYVCEENYRFLPAHIKERVKLRYQPQFGEYFLSNFRRPAEFEKFTSGQYPYAFPFFFIEVDKEPIIGVYRLH